MGSQRVGHDWATKQWQFHVYPAPSRWHPPQSTFCLWVWLLQVLDISEVRQRFLLCRLISLSVVSPRFIHMQQVSESPSFWWLDNIPLWVCKYNGRNCFSIRPRWTLGNTDTSGISVLVVTHPEVGWLYHTVILFSIFWGPPVLFSIVNGYRNGCTIYIPTNSAQGFPFCTSFRHLIFWLFTRGLPNACEGYWYLLSRSTWRYKESLCLRYENLQPMFLDDTRKLLVTFSSAIMFLWSQGIPALLGDTACCSQRWGVRHPKLLLFRKSGTDRQRDDNEDRW